MIKSMHWAPVHVLALPFTRCVVLVSNFPSLMLFPVLHHGINGTHFTGYCEDENRSHVLGAFSVRH